MFRQGSRREHTLLGDAGTWDTLETPEDNQCKTDLSLLEVDEKHYALNLFSQFMPVA